MKCWDTQDIEALYDKDRLTRKDLLSGIRGLWELVEAHQTQCDYEKIGYLVKNLNGDQKEESLESLADMLHYDTRIRSLAAGKGRMDAEIAAFLFGQPLTETLGRFGVFVQKQGNGFNIRLCNS